MKNLFRFILPCLFLFPMIFFGEDYQIENFNKKKSFFSRALSLEKIKLQEINNLIKIEGILPDGELFLGAHYYNNYAEKKLKKFSENQLLNSEINLQKPEKMHVFDWGCLLSHDLDRILYNKKIFTEEYKTKALLIAKELFAVRAQKYDKWYATEYSDKIFNLWEYRNIFQIITAIRLNEKLEAFIDTSELNFYNTKKNSELRSMLSIADNIIASRGILNFTGRDYKEKLINFIELNKSNGEEMSDYTESIKKYFFQNKWNKTNEQNKFEMAELYFSDYSKVAFSERENLISPYIKVKSEFSRNHNERIYEKNLYFLNGIEYKEEYYKKINQNILAVIKPKISQTNFEEKYIFFANKISNYLSNHKRNRGEFEISSILKNENSFGAIYDPIYQRIYFEKNFNLEEINNKISEMLFSKRYNNFELVAEKCLKHSGTSNCIIKKLFEYSGNKKSIKTSQDFYEYFLTESLIKKNYPESCENIFQKLEKLTNFIIKNNKNPEIKNVADFWSTVASTEKNNFLFECSKIILNNKIEKTINGAYNLFCENFNSNLIESYKLAAMILNFEIYKSLKEVLNKNDNDLISEIFKGINGEKTTLEYKNEIIKQAPKLLQIKEVAEKENKNNDFFEMLRFIDEIILKINDKNFRTRENFASILLDTLFFKKTDHFEKFYERTLFIKKLLENGYEHSYNNGISTLALIAKFGTSLIVYSKGEITDFKLSSKENIDMLFKILKKDEIKACDSCNNEIIKDSNYSPNNLFNGGNSEQIKNLIKNNALTNLRNKGLKEVKLIEDNSRF